MLNVLNHFDGNYISSSALGSFHVLFVTTRSIDTTLLSTKVTNVSLKLLHRPNWVLM